MTANYRRTHGSGFLLAPLSIAALSIAIATLGACSDGGGEIPPPGELAASELSRELAPEVSAEQARTLVAGNTGFALDAYRVLGEADGNVFYSPLSISTALAMTYAGARGATESQMAGALHYDLSQAELHPAFNSLDLQLASRGQGSAGEGFRLTIANATFGQKGYEFLPDYLDVLAVNYGAGMSLLDFASDAAGSRKAINDWVGKVTEDRIPELLAEGVINPSTRLVLTNAVYFKAAWKTPFEENATTGGTFHGLDGDVTVDMMSGTPASMGHAAGEGFRAVSLPYQGDELDMVLIMPDEGNFSAFEAGLDAATLAGIFADLDDGQNAGGSGALVMPKFEFRFKSDLVAMFQSLGMTDAFDGAADFSGIDGTRNLAISAIVHEAFVNVNEAGTEAAAATAVGFDESAAPQSLTIDRPFVFLIRDVETGAIVFLGRVTDPTK